MPFQFVKGQPDSLKTKKSATKDSLSLIIDRRPRNAFWLGMLLPGGGQIYNDRWWKLPIAYIGYGGALYNIKFNRGIYNEWNEYYELALKTNMKVEVRPGILFDAKQIKVYRDKARDQKDVALFIAIGAHLIISLEAYVDAHLKNFNIDEDLSIKAFPESKGIGIAYALH